MRIEYKKYIFLLIPFLIICATFILYRIFQFHPDFSKSDWYIEHHFDVSGQDTTIYWKTFNNYSIGENLYNYSIITRSPKLVTIYKLVPIKVYSKNRNYITSKVPLSEVDAECMRIITNKGKVVETFERVFSDWFPIPGWGKQCKNLDWKEKYLELINKTTI